MPKFGIIRLGLVLLTASIISPYSPQSSWAAEAFHPDGDARRRAEADDARSKERRDEDAIARSREPWRSQDNTNRPRQEFHDGNALEAKIEAQRRQASEAREKIVENVYNHAYEEHSKEYGSVSSEQFKNIAMEHLEHPDDKTDLHNGETTAYWSDKHQSVLIVNNKKPESSTMFKPERGKEYYEEQKNKYASKGAT